LEAEVLSVTAIGNRVRLGLASSQPLAAEITAESVDQLGLHPGDRVSASWKATATRIVSA
jgi:molybdate transport system ATP-binding protein